MRRLWSKALAWLGSEEAVLDVPARAVVVPSSIQVLRDPSGGRSQTSGAFRVFRNPQVAKVGCSTSGTIRRSERKSTPSNQKASFELLNHDSCGLAVFGSGVYASRSIIQNRERIGLPG